MERISIAFINVNSVKFTYVIAGIEDRIYIRFAKTNLFGQA